MGNNLSLKCGTFPHPVTGDVNQALPLGWHSHKGNRTQDINSYPPGRDPLSSAKSIKK